MSPPFAAGNKKQNKTEHLVHGQMKLMVSLMFSVLNFIYLFIFGCAGSLLLPGLIASCCEQRILSSSGVQASPHSGALALGHAGFSS